mmetsp:Transcript_22743/g.42709  ORF Transcript_22743/g.42709 Transcript_22743/m.42709 type:complete len:511 (-) Transcript_22743:416-1948(-)
MAEAGRRNVVESYKGVDALLDSVDFVIDSPGNGDLEFEDIFLPEGSNSGHFNSIARPEGRLQNAGTKDRHCQDFQRQENQDQHLGDNQRGGNESKLSVVVDCEPINGKRSPQLPCVKSPNANFDIASFLIPINRETCTPEAEHEQKESHPPAKRFRPTPASPKVKSDPGLDSLSGNCDNVVQHLRAKAEPGSSSTKKPRKRIRAKFRGLSNSTAISSRAFYNSEKQYQPNFAPRDHKAKNSYTLDGPYTKLPRISAPKRHVAINSVTCNSGSMMGSVGPSLPSIPPPNRSGQGNIQFFNQKCFYKGLLYIGPTLQNRPKYKAKQKWEWNFYPHGVSKLHGKLRIQIKQRGFNPSYPLFPNTLEGLLGASLFRDMEIIELWNSGVLVRSPKFNFFHGTDIKEAATRKYMESKSVVGESPLRFGQSPGQFRSTKSYQTMSNKPVLALPAPSDQSLRRPNPLSMESSSMKNISKNLHTPNMKRRRSCSCDGTHWKCPREGTMKKCLTCRLQFA